MAWPIGPTALTTWILAATCLALPAAGCDHAPAVEQPSTRLPQAPFAPNIRDRVDYSIGRQSTFFALADTSSNLSDQPSPFRFVDITESSHIDFVHVSGVDERKLYPTAFGSGVGMLDYDGDGRLDLYFATCQPLPLGSGPKSSNRLYKNLGGGRFEDVTEASGLGFSGFCHGIIAGDLDNDGDPDVFLCNYGSNALFVNNGDGTFRDVGRTSGIDAPNWSSGGAMLDYDGDGDLDVYVANYGDWVYPQDAHRCGNDRVPLFCSPWEIRTVKHILYRNDGGLKFTDVTDQAGLGRADGHGFGVVAADLNGDGRTDLYVANDLNPNFLYLNRGDGTFEDATEVSGAAFNESGLAQSSMGVDAEDCDGDGLPELFVSNFQNEHIAFYRNLGGAPVSFREASAVAGLAAASKPWVGWGCALADFDNDGWPDAFVANGHIDPNRKDLAPMMTYDEPPLLFRNVPTEPGSKAGGRRFELSTRDVGPYLVDRHVARGAAFGDIDDDGDVDIVVNHMDGRPAILRNDTPGDGAWVRLTLVGTRSNRDAIGARVEIEAGGRVVTRLRKGGCSMQSTNDPRLLVGLGPADAIKRITIYWPSGFVDVLRNIAPRASYVVVESGGDVAPAPERVDGRRRDASGGADADQKPGE
ncbi:MAG: CRTAC1 family protein [Paludisphaera borealis]|uniref:CRTAC1 family protein n=1 Tax=Paludisphaera borealis TaxID=1387353 RepID=UPI0028481B84|nr:CRTAC1 family protein [Paludisphaera borealis]MDR3622156.1 CRTAC1 family protein [Paludisphaera borealis]